ncbi:nitrous oxide-stimulated promoter family protein [Dysgonomonas sp. BGC7]|uniref:nitrous oxide-stimulated promoter family protein n=1 Tax=Dysgonomonas sp. BGC7 TaxID=1658008 RepID=UPI0006809544|nr:nitrous oxide-stimulated promoter family protein [Dysgonomonas sp. BGC7]MBD8389069.1 nitrous oxide-stimulated promoter family protein [Dysgonomonas sp. BGC7]
MNNTEKRTVTKMIHIYCAAKHNTSGKLCPDCKDLNIYALNRLEKCRFGEDKPNCEKCPVHCYRPDMRQNIKEVMRYSGPQMLFRSPLLAILHLIRNLIS